MVIPWVLNRNGQAITLNNKLKQAGVRTTCADKAIGRQSEGKRRAADVCDDLPAGNPRDVDPLLARLGRDSSGQGRQPDHHPARADGGEHEGRQDGRLLRRRAVEQPRHRGRHRLHRVTTQQMWKDHPEKVCAFTEEFATKNPKAVKAVLKALHLASVDLDKMDNRAKFAEVIARPTYINCPPAIILERLMGSGDYGDGRSEQDPNYMISAAQHQLPASDLREVVADTAAAMGLHEGHAGLQRRREARDASGHLPRGDERARRQGQRRRGTEDQALFDGVFDGKDPEKYASRSLYNPAGWIGTRAAETRKRGGDVG